jgi:hypothetical protein
VELDGKLPVVYSVGIGTTYKQLCQNLGLTMNSHVLVVTRAMRSHFLQLADHPLEKGNQYRLITFTPKKLDTKK